MRHVCEILRKQHSTRCSSVTWPWCHGVWCQSFSRRCQPSGGTRQSWGRGMEHATCPWGQCLSMQLPGGPHSWGWIWPYQHQADFLGRCSSRESILTFSILPTAYWEHMGFPKRTWEGKQKDWRSGISLGTFRWFSVDLEIRTEQVETRCEFTFNAFFSAHRACQLPSVH